MKHPFTICRVLLLLAFFQYCLPSAAQSIGIGTDKPSANAALDVYSTSKGLMFPRVDTAAVTNPSAGLLIYSQQLKAPAFYNGTRWNKLAGTTGNAAGALAASVLQTPSSIVYTIVGGGGRIPIASGTFTNAVALSNGITQPTLASSTGAGAGAGKLTFTSVIIQKAIDANSISFINALAAGGVIKTITFDVYFASSDQPAYTIKLTNALLSSYQVNFGDQAIEQLGFTAAIYGYKVGTQTFAWNTATNTAVPF